MNVVGLGLGVVAALAGFTWLKVRWNRGRNRVLDPVLVREKISQAAFQAEVEVVAILPQGADRARAQQLLEPVADAYRRYDHPAGARFEAGKLRPWLPEAALRWRPRRRAGSARPRCWACASWPRFGIRPARATRPTRSAAREPRRCRRRMSSCARARTSARRSADWRGRSTSRPT